MWNLHKRRIYKALKEHFNKNKHICDNSAVLLDTAQDDMQWTDRDTLVGVLRNKEQLDAALKNKFYHIPAKYISEYDLPLKYIAIYQSKSLFGNNAGIYYYGKISSVRCLKRKYICEIPKASHEYYYRFDVKEWKQLSSPIEAKEIGFIRIYTNFEMLQNSTEIPQLLLKNKVIHTLYSDIKNKITKVQENPEIESQIIYFGNFHIVVELDDLLIYKNQRLINSFSVYDFIDLPNTIITQIYKIVKN